MLDARFKKSLGVADSSDGATQMSSQVIGGFVSAVGQVPLTMCPDVFNRVKLGSVAGQTEDMEPIIFCQEGFNVRSFVDGAAVPDKNHMFSQMPQQISKESDDLMTCDVVGMETHIEAKSSASRRDCKASNGRNLFMAVTVAKDWRLTRWRPSLTDNRYEQEPAFVEKGQMGPKFLGFFLYWAKLFSSIRLLPSRSAAKHVSPASGNSSQNCFVIASRLRHRYNVCRILTGSGLRYASASICRWHDLLMQLLAAAFSSSWFFAARLVRAAAPTEPGSEFPSGLFPDRFETSERLNLRRLSAFPQHSGRFCLNAA